MHDACAQNLSCLRSHRSSFRSIFFYVAAPRATRLAPSGGPPARSPGRRLRGRPATAAPGGAPRAAPAGDARAAPRGGGNIMKPAIRILVCFHNVGHNVCHNVRHNVPHNVLSYCSGPRRPGATGRRRPGRRAPGRLHGQLLGGARKTRTRKICY